MQLLLVGANHKSAELSAREPLSFDAERASYILTQVLERDLVLEAVLLSTCNRSEIYAIVRDPRAAREAIVRLLSQETALPLAELENHLYTYYNKFAASHLFEVAAGLDSMVLGENEILRQVKEALELSMRLESSGAILNQLFRFAITAGKRVRTETEINRGVASMAGLAARLVRERLQTKTQPRLLVLGAGQMARVLVQNLNDMPLNIHMLNRSLERAQALMQEHSNISAVGPLNDLVPALQEADAVVVCTAHPGYLLRPEHFVGQAMGEQDSKTLVVDLSVPRNVDPECEELTTVELHDVDALQDQVKLSLEQRSRYIADAQSIIAEEATAFLEWFHNRDVVPTIRGLYATFEDIRQREIERGIQKYKQQLSPEAEAVLERVTRAITQKILHHPVARLKNASPQEQHLYQEALDALFGLDAEDEIDKYVKMPRQAERAAPKKP